MLAIIMTPIPRILLLQSADGAIGSMLIGTVVGVLFTYITVKFFIQFPGKDLIELLQKYTSSWVRVPVTIYFALMWFIAGLITLVMTVFLLITFLTPEMSIYTIALSLLITVFFGVLLKSKSVLFTLEIVLILMVPVGILIFIKLYSSSEFDWDQARLAVMHINEIPKYSSFVATIFTFMGCANLIIYNKYFKEKQNLSILSLIIIGAFGVFMLVTSYFVPIGLSGFDQIDQLIFPWTTSADAVRMKFGIIERVVFIFMFLFVTISFISMIVHWHVAYKLILSVFRMKSLQVKQQNFTPFLVVLVFSIIGLWLSAQLSQYQLYQYARYFYYTLPLLVAVLFFTMLAIKRGASQ
ncbi:GerAB/ArcD/ProY family transporter [Sporosarcina sp. A2]|uniref:GerAB/ArcD/ProY family transporter n=1 Tax=Sporosarcina sp. A2 TaxID=3393449 RepID=UPI003D7A1A5C